MILICIQQYGVPSSRGKVLLSSTSVIPAENRKQVFFIILSFLGFGIFGAILISGFKTDWTFGLRQTNKEEVANPVQISKETPSGHSIDQDTNSNTDYSDDEKESCQTNGVPESCLRNSSDSHQPRNPNTQIAPPGPLSLGVKDNIHRQEQSVNEDPSLTLPTKTNKMYCQDCRKEILPDEESYEKIDSNGNECIMVPMCDLVSKSCNPTQTFEDASYLTKTFKVRCMDCWKQKEDKAQIERNNNMPQAYGVSRSAIDAFGQMESQIQEVFNNTWETRNFIQKLTNHDNNEKLLLYNEIIAANIRVYLQIIDYSDRSLEQMKDRIKQIENNISTSFEAYVDLYQKDHSILTEGPYGEKEHAILLESLIELLEEIHDPQSTGHSFDNNFDIDVMERNFDIDVMESDDLAAIASGGTTYYDLNAKINHSNFEKQILTLFCSLYNRMDRKKSKTPYEVYSCLCFDAHGQYQWNKEKNDYYKIVIGEVDKSRSPLDQLFGYYKVIITNISIYTSRLQLKHLNPESLAHPANTISEYFAAYMDLYLKNPGIMTNSRSHRLNEKKHAILLESLIDFWYKIKDPKSQVQNFYNNFYPLEKCPPDMRVHKNIEQSLVEKQILKLFASLYQQMYASNSPYNKHKNLSKYTEYSLLCLDSSAPDSLVWDAQKNNYYKANEPEQTLLGK